ncbi:MAG TPA: hypothetical protein VH763_14685 [Gemmatimonadales bacterium]
MEPSHGGILYDPGLRSQPRQTARADGQSLTWTSMIYSPPGSGAFSPFAPPYRVRAVDPSNEADSRAAARLHSELFQHIGPIAQLGDRLLQRYCYGYLLRTGLMKAVLFEVDDQPVALAAYTDDSTKLQHAALRSHLPFVALQGIRALVGQPGLIARFPAAVRLLWDRHHEKFPDAPGSFAEVTAFGVLPHVRTREFVRRTGLRIPDLLLEFVIDDLRAHGATEIRGMVLASNTPAVAFFKRYMTRFEPFPSARPSFRFWLDLTAEPARRSAG